MEVSGVLWMYQSAVFACFVLFFCTVILRRMGAYIGESSLAHHRQCIGLAVMSTTACVANQPAGHAYPLSEGYGRHGRALVGRCFLVDGHGRL